VKSLIFGDTQIFFKQCRIGQGMPVPKEELVLYRDFDTTLACEDTHTDYS